MATPPVWQLTNPDNDTQESMFDDATTFPAGEMYSEESARPSGNAADQGSQPVAVLSADEFAGLEERIQRAVSLVRREREARKAAEERSVALEAQLHELQSKVDSEAQSKTASVEALQQEIASLRAEREQVRIRVDRLLSQLDTLEL
jgi:predicted RNase H-like nuclease (RuvC/YqgF family)